LDQQLCNLAAAVNGFFVQGGTGENGSNGLVNFVQDPAGPDGDFRLTGGAVNGYPDQRFPGIPGSSTSRETLDSIVGEATAWVEFPTNGTYTMGVASDDGFRVTRGFGAAGQQRRPCRQQPASIAGQKAAVATTLYNTDTVSTPHTNVITGKIVQALGVWQWRNRSDICMRDYQRRPAQRQDCPDLPRHVRIPGEGPERRRRRRHCGRDRSGSASGDCRRGLVPNGSGS
jgi:hypothetical protein